MADPSVSAQVSECCAARVTMHEGDYITEADVLVTIHEPDGTTKLVQPRVCWWVCAACGERCDTEAAA